MKLGLEGAFNQQHYERQVEGDDGLDARLLGAELLPRTVGHVLGIHLALLLGGQHPLRAAVQHHCPPRIPYGLAAHKGCVSIPPVELLNY